MSEEVMLSLDGVGKRFPGTVALDGATMDVRRHEVVGLIGENGAGKSTLLKILAGLQRPDSGTMSVAGEKVRFNNVNEAMAHGVAMVFQEQSLVPNVSVAENIFLGNEGESVRAGTYRWKNLNDRAARYLSIVADNIDPRARTSSLSFARRQMVEVAKALACGERSQVDHDPVILLDEPTSVLEHGEIERLFGIIDTLRERASVVFVSHRMEEVLRICDRVYVMRDGRIVGERRPADTSIDELLELMVGKDLSGGYYHEDKRTEATEDVALSVKGLTGSTFTEMDLDVRRGEVVSLLGVQDSGREDFARALFGALRTKRGTIALNGKKLRLRYPSDAVSVGIGYVPSERKVDGAVLALDVAQNMTIAHPGEVSRGGLLNRKLEKSVVNSWIDKLRIKTSGTTASLINLSGGNQQKVVLAKWLMDPDLELLVLDTPTRGLDVGAKADVYGLIRELAAQGLAVVIVADTLEEAIFMSHRVLTMKDGVITGEFSSSATDRPERTALLERML